MHRPCWSQCHRRQFFSVFLYVCFGLVCFFVCLFLRKIIQKTLWDIFKIFKTIIMHYSDTDSKRHLKGRKKLTTFVAGKIHVRNTDVCALKGWDPGSQRRQALPMARSGADCRRADSTCLCKALSTFQTTSIISWMFTNLLWGTQDRYYSPLHVRN